MRWSCSWGGAWGTSTCASCQPFTRPTNEPKLLTAVPIGPIIGAVAAVAIYDADVAGVGTFWTVGPTVDGEPTIDDC